MQDKPTVDALARFLKDWKPKHRICGGDVWDFRALRCKASEAEKRDSLLADFDAGIQWLDQFAPTHDLILGNHDQRLWNCVRTNQGPLADLCAEKIEEISEVLKKHKVWYRQYNKRTGVIRFGHLKLLHGFFAGITSARQHALAYGSCLFGHVHAVDEASIPGLERRVARAVGAMCRLDMDYNSTMVNTLRHANGWAYGVINDKTGDYQVFQAEAIGGKFIVANDVNVI